MKLRLLLVLPLLLGIALGQNLLTNGDFEQDMSVGWTATQGGAGSHVVERYMGQHPDPDYEVLVQQVSGSGWTKCHQIVDITDVDVEVSFWAQFYIGGGWSTCWPVTAVFIEYLDENGLFLGDTRICHHNAYWNWVPTSTRHLITVTNPDWTEYTYDIRQELDNNLPGVNVADVAKIGVALYDYTSGG